MNFRLLLGAPVVLLAWPLACGSNASSGASFGDDEGGTTEGGGTSCPGCVTTQSCSGGAQCVELASNLYCAQPCGNGGSCSGGDSCVSVKTYSGAAAQVCVPAGECGGGSSSSGGSSGGSSGSSSSGGSSGSSSGGVGYDGGAVTGTIGNNGGTLSALYFGVVGDTRPPNEDDVSAYPASTIQAIFKALALPQFNPPFILATGDYQFSSTGSSSTAAQQLSMYTQARSVGGYTGVQFAAMGNHECTGADVSNCVSGTSQGLTANYNAFMSQLLGPVQKTTPYYAINVNAIDGSWTAKFVMTAANAWDSTQQTWLTTTMAQKTTYTFVVRHEPTEDYPSEAPPSTPTIDSIINASSYTLLIVGHSHTFGHYTTPYPREVIIGNGGAPLSNSSKYFGFALFKMRSDGAIVADMLNMNSPYATDSEFHFVVEADGTLTK